MKTTARVKFLLMCLWVGVLAVSAQGQAIGIDWLRQFGTSSADLVFGMAADSSGNTYVGGITVGSGAFVRKYDASGAAQWTQPFGSSSDFFDPAGGVALDPSGTSVYVVGGTTNTTLGTVEGSGFILAFVRKYDASGTHVWTREFGPSSSFPCAVDGSINFFPTARAHGTAADSSGVYVVGSACGALAGESFAGSPGVLDAFVRKYNADGSVAWTREFGTTGSDLGLGAAVDSSGVYVAGGWAGSNAGVFDGDAFVRKYDSNGTQLWADIFGSSNADAARAVTAPSSGVYVAGSTDGTLPGGQTNLGGTDAFLRKYNALGTPQWTTQFPAGSDTLAAGTAVAADASGIFLAGSVFGALPGQTGAGQFDTYVRKYDSSGTAVWTKQLGCAGNDAANGVAVANSAVYVAGTTFCAMPGQTALGSRDGFVAKLVELPILTVTIDIKPGSFPNSINLGSGGTVPVAIFSTATFNACTEVNPTTVALAGANVALKGKGSAMASCQDVNGDGLLDLVVHVSTDALQVTNGDTQATLTGQTYSGLLIQGTDSIRIVP